MKECYGLQAKLQPHRGPAVDCHTDTLATGYGGVSPKIRFGSPRADGQRLATLDVRMTGLECWTDDITTNARWLRCFVESKTYSLTCWLYTPCHERSIPFRACRLTAATITRPCFHHFAPLSVAQW